MGLEQFEKSFPDSVSFTVCFVVGMVLVELGVCGVVILRRAAQQLGLESEDNEWAAAGRAEEGANKGVKGGPSCRVV